jgi:hypothetical protein
VIYSTAPLGVYFATGKETRGINQVAPDELREQLHEANGYLVVFESMPLEIYGYTADEYLADMALVDEFKDCYVYKITP